MVNLADQDTSFLVPCRHCGDLMPEQDRICPHCGKDQGAMPERGTAASPRGDAVEPDVDGQGSGNGDFTRAGIVGPDAAGASRRGPKIFGVVVLIAGVLLLGAAFDRYRKQGVVAVAPATPAVAREADRSPSGSATATAASGSVAQARSASAPVPAPAAPEAQASRPAASPAAIVPPATASTPPATADTPPQAAPCNEALAALSLCVLP